MTTPNTPDVAVRDRIYIAADSGLLSDKDVKSRYGITLYNEAMCGKCSNRPFRPNDMCLGCSGFLGKYNFAGKTQLKGRDYHSLPLADVQYIRGLLTKHRESGKKPLTADVKPIKPPMKSKLKFTGELFGEGAVDADGNPRANQKRLVAEWLRLKNGILVAMPRSGKTVMAVYIACELGVKTLVIAHQKEFLSQFYATFCGDKKSKRAAVTNAKTLEKKYGHPVVKIVNKIDDLLDDECDVFLCNPQKFYHKLEGKADKYLKGRFGLLVVDECLPGDSVITMADGSTKRIDGVRVGDMVQSVNHETGCVEARQVISTKRTARKRRMVEIQHEQGTLVCTENHRVFVVGKGYVYARDLGPNDEVVVNEEGRRQKGLPRRGRRVGQCSGNGTAMQRGDNRRPVRQSDDDRCAL